MAKVQVKATMLGYYENQRKRENQIFWMDEKFMKVVDGKAVLPKWVVLASKKKVEADPEPEVETKKILDDEVI